MHAGIISAPAAEAERHTQDNQDVSSAHMARPAPEIAATASGLLASNATGIAAKGTEPAAACTGLSSASAPETAANGAGVAKAGNAAVDAVRHSMSAGRGCSLPLHCAAASAMPHSSSCDAMAQPTEGRLPSLSQHASEVLCLAHVSLSGPTWPIAPAALGLSLDPGQEVSSAVVLPAAATCSASMAMHQTPMPTATALSCSCVHAAAPTTCTQMTQAHQQLTPPHVSTQQAVSQPSDSSNQLLTRRELSSFSSGGQYRPHAVQQDLPQQAHDASAPLINSCEGLLLPDCHRRYVTMLTFHVHL